MITRTLLLGIFVLTSYTTQAQLSTSINKNIKKLADQADLIVLKMSSASLFERSTVKENSENLGEIEDVWYLSGEVLKEKKIRKFEKRLHRKGFEKSENGPNEVYVHQSEKKGINEVVMIRKGTHKTMIYAFTTSESTSSILLDHVSNKDESLAFLPYFK